ncbi:hypothetical protein CAOG_002463 [Capsaspora owczarzaki ATCC 30864]|uniref:Uncharacterized protein n=2 Tax=Capsaspora owczarzaki (strain ATCC 30864) TaxID=595528 RepID=A0A0D2X1S3_CAPO3|nr:hypothetical protein CAOG_002463 [Capsaspora owczarzaki ATCC 30864]
MSGNDVLATVVTQLIGSEQLRARVRELETERDALKRELADARRQHAQEMEAARRQHIDRLEQKHAEQIRALNDRVTALEQQLEQHRRVAAEERRVAAEERATILARLDKVETKYDKVLARLDAMEGALALGQIVYDLEEKIVLWVLANDKDKKRRLRLNTVRSLTDPWVSTHVSQLNEKEQQRANSVQSALDRLFGNFHAVFKEAKKIGVATARPPSEMSQEDQEKLARAHVKDEMLLKDMLRIIEFYHLDVPTIIARCEAEQDSWQTA